MIFIQDEYKFTQDIMESTLSRSVTMTLTADLSKVAGPSQLISSTGHRPASLCYGPLSVVHACICPTVCASVCLYVHPSICAPINLYVPPSVCPLPFSLNIFFYKITYRNLMKFHRNIPTMVLFRIS